MDGTGRSRDRDRSRRRPGAIGSAARWPRAVDRPGGRWGPTAPTRSRIDRWPGPRGRGQRVARSLAAARSSEVGRPDFQGVGLPAFRSSTNALPALGTVAKRRASRCSSRPTPRAGARERALPVVVRPSPSAARRRLIGRSKRSSGADPSRPLGRLQRRTLHASVGLRVAVSRRRPSDRGSSTRPLRPLSGVTSPVRPASRGRLPAIGRAPRFPETHAAAASRRCGDAWAAFIGRRPPRRPEDVDPRVQGRAQRRWVRAEPRAMG